MLLQTVDQLEDIQRAVSASGLGVPPSWRGPIPMSSAILTRLRAKGCGSFRLRERRERRRSHRPRSLASCKGRRERKETVMRSEKEGFVLGLATGRIPAPGAHTLDHAFMEESDMCVYDCGRLALLGQDCCQECLDEAHQPLPFLQRKRGAIR